MLVAVAGVLAQGDSSVILQNVSVVEEKGGVKVEADLTSPVIPRVTLETNPDRLVLELPDTVPASQQAPIAVNQNGVASVRVEVGGTTAAVFTRVVVFLSEARHYTLAAEDAKIVLRVLPPEPASTKKRNGPVPAASAPIVGRVHRKQPEEPTTDTPNDASSIAPPPALPPISFPDQQPAAAPGDPGVNSEASAAKQAVTLQTATPSVTQAEGQTNSPDQDTQAASAPSQANPDVRIAFKVKYVAEGVVYLDGGRNDGLVEGMKLVVKEIDPESKPTAGKTEDVQPIADLEVASAALSSAVSEIHNATRPVKSGTGPTCHRKTRKP